MFMSLTKKSWWKYERHVTLTTSCSNIFSKNTHTKKLPSLEWIDVKTPKKREPHPIVTSEMKLQPIDSIAIFRMILLINNAYSLSMSFEITCLKCIEKCISIDCISMKPNNLAKFKIPHIHTISPPITIRTIGIITFGLIHFRSH